MTYKQLTREQRYQIYAFMKAGIFQTEIAKVIGVHKSTICRERRRNRGRRGYRPKQAQHFAEIRRAKAVTTRISQIHGYWSSVSCRTTGVLSKLVGGLVVSSK
jgi:IS30 family transposase